MKLTKLCALLLLGLAAGPLHAQAVLFDGVTPEAGHANALLIPALISGDDYTAAARINFGVTNRFQVLAEGGGTFNGGATPYGAFGWAGTFHPQSKVLPLNIGLFNSYLFPIRSGGPDALITVAPVLSHSFERSSGGAVTPYAGAALTFTAPGGGTRVNGLFGIRVAQIAERWDFIAEVQPGDRTQVALGFTFRF